MLKRIGYLFAILALACGLFAVHPKAVSAAPNDRRITFMGDSPDHTESRIISMNPDGSDRRDYGPGYFPELSPDGTKIAFSVPVDNFASRDLYTVNVDGSNRTRVSEHVFSNESGGLHFSWSPDSTKLAYTLHYGAYIKENGSEYKQIAVVNADGTGQTQLTNDPSRTNDTNPLWSPDGTKIMYTRYHLGDDYPDVKIMNADGTGQYTAAAHAVRISWSPDNTKILYNAYGPGLQVSNLDGSNAVTLVGNATDPTWSPDGTRIAMLGQCSGCGGTGYGLTTIKPDGTDQQLLVQPPSGGGLEHPAWSPDSSRIIYSEYAPWESPRLSSVPSGGGPASLVALEPAGYAEWAYLYYTPSDTTPPIVTGTPDRQPNSHNWYNGDVTITWDSTDPSPSSGTPTQPAPTVASQEGSYTYTSAQSCDPANNCAAGSLMLNIDKTKPTISASAYPAPNASGWNNSNVTVSFICRDNTSGIDTCPDPVTVSSDSAGQTVTGTAVDNAGNTGSASVTVKLDKTAPSVSNLNMSGIIHIPFMGALLLGNTTTISATVADNLSGVTAAEYYFDTDPGQGNATALTVSNGQATATANVAGLHGQHRLYVRTLDAAGNWSTTASMAFRHP